MQHYACVACWIALWACCGYVEELRCDVKIKSIGVGHGMPILRQHAAACMCVMCVKGALIGAAVLQYHGKEYNMVTAGL